MLSTTIVLSFYLFFVVAVFDLTFKDLKTLEICVFAISINKNIWSTYPKIIQSILSIFQLLNVFQRKGRFFSFHLTSPQFLDRWGSRGDICDDVEANCRQDARFSAVLRSVGLSILVHSLILIPSFTSISKIWKKTTQKSVNLKHSQKKITSLC